MIVHKVETSQLVPIFSHLIFGWTISLMIIIRIRETKKISWLNVQGASSIDARFLQPSTAHTGCTISMKFRQLLPLIPQCSLPLYLPVTKNGLLQESQRGAIVTGIRAELTGRLRTWITSRTTLLSIFPGNVPADATSPEPERFLGEEMTCT